MDKKWFQNLERRTPSPGTPGEGRGEGDLECRGPLVLEITRTPTLSRGTGRGGNTSRSLAVFLAVVGLLWCRCAMASIAATRPSIEEKSLGKIGAYDKVKVVVVSSDGLHVAFIGVRGKQQWVVRDGVESQPWDWIVPSSLAMSPDGSRYAYVVQSATQTIPVVDGTPQAPCFAIGGNRVIFTRAGKQFAYVVQLGGADSGAQLVSDASTGPTYDAIDFPMFSPDGTHLAYRATRGKQQFVVLDGKAQTAVDRILDSSMVFSPDGKHLAYGLVEAGKSHVMFDGVESDPYDKLLLGPGFSPGGAHLASVVLKDGKTVVVLDGREQAPSDGVVAGDLTFSSDDKHLAYGVKRGGKSMVIVDGVPDESFDALANSTLHFSDDSRHLAYEAVYNGKSVIVLDKLKLDAFEGGLVDTPIFSADGSRLLFGCRHQGKWLIVIWDGKQRTEVGPFDAVAQPGFSPDGKRFSFRCIDHEKFYADVDGTLSPVLEAVGPILFGPDSKHVVYLARRAGHSHLVVDGVETAQEFDARLSGEAPDFDSSDSLHFLSLRNGEIFLEKIRLK
jgi:Tol biopolymer transport system component